MALIIPSVVYKFLLQRPVRLRIGTLRNQDFTEEGLGKTELLVIISQILLGSAAYTEYKMS